MVAKKTTSGKKKATGKDLVSKEAQDLVNQMDGYGQDGYEDSDSDSFAVPFVRILQQNSPQLLEEGEAYIKGAKAGHFFNNLTEDLYGKKLDVITVHFNRDFIEWQPNRGGFVMSHGADDSIRRRVVEVSDKNEQIMDNGNVLQEARNHFILLPDHLNDGPMIFSLVSTGIRHSKRWMSIMRRMKNPVTGKVNNPTFMGIWQLSTALNESEDGNWYQIGTKSSGKYEFSRLITADEFEAVKAARDMILSGRAKVDYESGTTTSAEDGTDDDTPF